MQQRSQLETSQRSGAKCFCIQNGSIAPRFLYTHPEIALYISLLPPSPVPPFLFEFIALQLKSPHTWHQAVPWNDLRGGWVLIHNKWKEKKIKRLPEFAPRLQTYIFFFFSSYSAGFTSGKAYFYHTLNRIKQQRVADTKALLLYFK